MEHLWFDLGGCAGGTQLAVHLRGSSARVSVMDADEYQAYLDGDEYEYHGSFFDVSPVVLEVPYDDDWYLVVDSYHGRIKVKYEEVFD
ncbi:DUF1883 domain-containing protein [Micromonospora sp. C72]|uniref:DUF1883 domain-containing protein n=1 Tax=Micromonospora sp. C72 TaxID=2824880 RepID=UPI001B38329E|nr:DUF1883 domain-containing protein [Micromonospora sp. C72]MBQ1041442.1 DUF1883 domain-containing protein [Micromonospora sp. C72]